MAYESPQQYGILHLSEGEYLNNAFCTFFHSNPSTMEASLYAIELPYLGGSKEFDADTSDMLLKSLILPLSESSFPWKKVAETEFEKSQAESIPNVVPLDEFSGPMTILFVTQDVRVSMHGSISRRQLEDLSNILDASQQILGNQDSPL